MEMASYKRKIFATSFQPKDIREHVQALNASQGETEQQQIRTLVDGDGTAETANEFTDQGKNYETDPNSPAEKKGTTNSKWSQFLEHNDEEPKDGVDDEECLCPVAQQQVKIPPNKRRKIQKEKTRQETQAEKDGLIAPDMIGIRDSSPPSYNQNTASVGNVRTQAQGDRTKGAHIYTPNLSNQKLAPQPLQQQTSITSQQCVPSKLLQLHQNTLSEPVHSAKTLSDPKLFYHKKMLQPLEPIQHDPLALLQAAKPQPSQINAMPSQSTSKWAALLQPDSESDEDSS